MNPTETLLQVPLVRQGPNCGCGLAAVTMALKSTGHDVELEALEKHPLILPQMLQSWGIGPGRLGRVALACGARADPVVGEVFIFSIVIGIRLRSADGERFDGCAKLRPVFEDGWF